MVTILIKPDWFSGYDFSLELLFAFVAIMVFIYALKIYKTEKQKKLKLFGISFLLLAFSYISLFVTNFLNYAYLENKSIIRLETLYDLLILNNISIYLFILLFTTFVVTLSYMTLKTQNKKTFILIYAPIIISLALSTNKLLLFYIISSFLLLFIVHYYYKNYKRNKNTRSLIIFLAFIFLLFGRIHFIFSTQNPLFYTIGHLLELVAYSLILITLLRIKK